MNSFENCTWAIPSHASIPVAILPCTATPLLDKVQDGKGLFSLTARVSKF